MKRLLLVAVLALLAACSGESRWIETYGTNFPEPVPGRAALYIVRDAAPEGDPAINLTIGRRPVGGRHGRRAAGRVRDHPCPRPHRRVGTDVCADAHGRMARRRQ